MSPQDTSTKGIENKNVFRDTYLRFLGYANEVGESFRYQFPSLVKPSYGIAFAYVGADALYCAYRHSEKNKSIRDFNDEIKISLDDPRRVHAAIVGFDALTWQSKFIPRSLSFAITFQKIKKINCVNLLSDRFTHVLHFMYSTGVRIITWWSN